jgi:EH domain-containing protein 1
MLKLLEHITFVDTPGVLSGEKQRTQRSYDFTGVTSWFAAKCDLILLLFDPHKLDISDEFKRVIGSLRGHDDKIRVVLNKADQVDTQQLMRVYGALMWSLGKVLNTPEVARVYIGSFNDKPVNESAVGPIGKELFEREQDDLLSDLKDIPKKACDRRVSCYSTFYCLAYLSPGFHKLISFHICRSMNLLNVQEQPRFMPI